MLLKENRCNQNDPYFTKSLTGLSDSYYELRNGLLYAPNLCLDTGLLDFVKHINQELLSIVAIHNTT
jgi:hypothetical protein